MGNMLDKGVMEHAGQAHVWYSTHCFDTGVLHLLKSLLCPLPTISLILLRAKFPWHFSTAHSKISLSAFRTEGDVSLQVSSA